MTRRLLSIVLCLVLIAGCCLPAQADITTLDTALSRWLKDMPSVQFAASLQIKKLLPFDDATVTLLNGVLKHVTVNAALNFTGNDSQTDAQIAVDSQVLASWSERLQSGAYTLTTSLLPNRTLTSAKQPPADLLTAPDETDRKAADTVADPASAFSALDAVAELQQCYQALTNAIQPYTTEKKANYNIKGIGKGSYSLVAKLTTEQSQSLTEQLKVVLACGMDTAYRAEIAQMTFEKGFVVALYRNADHQDLCVYLKGNAAMPDKSKRKVAFQWAFSTNGLERKDLYQFSVSKTSGGTDKRVITANLTQENKSDRLGIQSESETALKRNKITDTVEASIELTGNRDEKGTLSCKGTVGSNTTHIENGETTTGGSSTEADITFATSGNARSLTGTVDSKTIGSGGTVTELIWTFAPWDGSGLKAEGKANVASPAASQTVEPTASALPASSLQQYTEATATDAPQVTTTPNAGTEYLVGSSPEGMKTYTVPSAETNIDLDDASTEILQSLLAEAAQNLAGKMVLAVAALPEEDRALLKDGMTDQDYAAFEALLGAL